MGRDDDGRRLGASPPSSPLRPGSKERRGDNKRRSARSTRGRWAIVGMTLFTVLLVQPYRGADAADVTADLAGVPSDTILGRLAHECSKYCHTGVSGLDLWLSLEEECISIDTMVQLRHQLTHGEAQPSSPLPLSSAPLPSSPSGQTTTLVGVNSAHAETGTAKAKQGWSVAHSFFLCVIVAVPGLFAGYRKGSRLAGYAPTVAAGAFCSLP